LLAGLAGVACYGIVKGVSGSDRAALFALVAMILAPANIIWSTLILTDVPGASVTAFTGLLWILAVRRGDKLRDYLLLMTACGLVTGLNSMIRPIGMMAVFIFSVASLLLVPLRRLKGVYALAGSACFVVMALLPPTIWRIHNYSQFGLNAVSTQQSYEPLKRLWMIDNNSYDQWVDYQTSLDSMAMNDSGIDWAVRDSIYSHRTRELFASNPVKYIIPHLISWPRLFSTGLQSNFLKPLYPESVPGIFYLAVLAVQGLFIGGFLYAVFTPSIRREHPGLLLIAVLWFLGTAVSTGPIAYSRYSLTFLWSWVSLFGISSDRLLSSLNRHHGKSRM
jgi:4-amino-4-deoxy-L-arabinose transferase-like glycosyltransferase